jgi:hypothetical protein
MMMSREPVRDGVVFLLRRQHAPRQDRTDDLKAPTRDVGVEHKKYLDIFEEIV